VHGDVLAGPLVDERDGPPQGAVTVVISGGRAGRLLVALRGRGSRDGPGRARSRAHWRSRLAWLAAAWLSFCRPAE
jgi:hypothetical protein